MASASFTGTSSLQSSSSYGQLSAEEQYYAEQSGYDGFYPPQADPQHGTGTDFAPGFAPEADPGFDPGYAAGDPGYGSGDSGYATGYAPEFEPAQEPAYESAPIPSQRSRSGRSRTEPATDPTGPRRNARPKSKTGVGGKAVRGLVILALVSSVTAFIAFDKTIELSVDGQTRQVHSFAGTVGAVLAANSVSTGGHDLVTPAPSAAATNDSTIVVRYGRPIELSVNGVKSQDWVHSTTVGGALAELGVRATGAVISTPVSTPIGRQGLTFTVYTQRQVTVLVDGKTMHLTTTAPTVAALLAQAGVTLQDQDTASAAADSVPVDGETVSVLRIHGTTEVKQVSIPYQTTKESDPTAYSGVTTVVTPGVDGIEQVTYALQVVNGVPQPAKQISETVTKQPVAEVVKVGTKALPTNVADLDWAALAQCESGGNPKSVDSSGTYFGLYQFSIATWDSLGGSGAPNQASAAEQTDLAELLYERSGVGQWPVCGPNLYK